ncbi:MAG: hypothetical protein V7L13_09095 [Nostoc sp.]|uniref:hypothetical protein n=1 Tax=Nostoc sp. TaxID=1180 RepID=UPI002FF5C878
MCKYSDVYDGLFGVASLVILKEYLEQSPVQQFINILGHRKRAMPTATLRGTQLEIFGGYDISKIGGVISCPVQDLSLRRQGSRGQGAGGREKEVFLTFARMR